MKAKVLWLDDEINNDVLKGTVNKVRKYFDIITCPTIQIFMEKIKVEEWDAIILDVLDENLKDDGFMEAILYILTNHKEEPWFVFSGRNQITKQENRIKTMLQTESCQRDYAEIIYEKSEENDKLFQDIRNAVSNKEEWKLKNQYKEVFSAFRADNYLQDEDVLLEILLTLHGNKRITHKNYYTPIRKILESIFRDANRIGLLHDKCIIEDKVNLTNSYLFLAGRKTIKVSDSLKIKCKKEHLPLIIEESITYILKITGGASHTTDPEKEHLVNLQAHWNEIDSSYLLNSLTFMLCDVLIWYKQYAEKNSNYQTNTAFWDDIPIALLNSSKDYYKNYNGIIEYDEENKVCFCEKCLIETDVKNTGKKISIRNVIENRDPTKYLFYVNERYFEFKP